MLKIPLTGRWEPFISVCFVTFCIIYVFNFCFFFLLFEPSLCHSKSTAISNRSASSLKLFQFFSRRLFSTINSVDILLYQVNGAFRKPCVSELLPFTVSPCHKTHETVLAGLSLERCSFNYAFVCKLFLPLLTRN